MVYADKNYLDGLEKRAAQMRRDVLASASEYPTGGNVYYIATNGNMDADGLSERFPVPFEKLSFLPLKEGDTVLFRRGDVFRGKISAAGGVTYSAYGEGEKPVINGSAMNYADETLWTETEYPNVYLLKEPVRNAGIIVLNYTYEPGNFFELTARHRTAGAGGFSGAQDLHEDTEFFSDLKTDKLYFYSTHGNPGAYYRSIDIGTCGDVIRVHQWTNNVTVDNLHITVGGSHGVGSESTVNLTVRNCVINWIGGSILTGFLGTDTVRYGNAVEIFGSADGYYVHNNWLYQIYDTGVTHQFNEVWRDHNVMQNVEYRDNLIEYCFWSIEYYNDAPGKTHTTKNVFIHDNFCRFNGYGWGCPGREDSAPMLSLGCAYEVQNNRIEHNVFDRSKGLVVVAYDTKNRPAFLFDANTYIQFENGHFGHVFGRQYEFTETEAPEAVKELGDSRAKIIFVKE